MGLTVRKLKGGGIRLEDAPEQTLIPTRYVDQAVAEGWMRRINERPVVRPAGPTQDILNSSFNGSPHLFIHCDTIIIYTVDGDYHYVVQHQPDKYVASGDDESIVSPEVYAAGDTRVDHFYAVELDTVHRKEAGRG